MAKKKPATGTRQWSERSYNFCVGCENNCRYCYARQMSVRLKLCTAEQWPLQVINHDKVQKPIVYRPGVWMFPTMHDITPANLSDSLTILKKMVEAGNRVLIVTKPRWDCIEAICREMKNYRTTAPGSHLIRMRFTIWSMADDVLRFWEPGASGFAERLDCLRFAYDCGFVTSVSCEPFLDGNTEELYHACLPYIRDGFWIGRMNHFNARVSLEGISDEQMGLYIKPMQRLLSDEYARIIYWRMRDYPIVRWKDSFRDIIAALSKQRSQG